MMALLRLLALLVATIAAAQARVTPIEEPFLPADAANPSSKGSKFVVAFTQNAPASDAAKPEAYFIVATHEVVTVEFDVQTKFGGVERTTPYEVNSTHPTRVTFPTTIDATTNLYVEDFQQSDKAIWVQTKDENHKISVFVINDELRSTDGFVALPCDAMSVPGFSKYEYIILSTDQAPTDQAASTLRSTQFLIITCEDNTVVTVTPSTTASGSGVFQHTTFGPDSTEESSVWRMGTNQNIPAKRTLLVKKTSDDFTGTVVKGTRPLVVISGHQCGQVPAMQTACDHIASQIPPHTTWGFTFLLSPLSGRQSGDFYRFATLLDNTEVTITCVDAGGTDTTVTTTTLSSAQRSNWGEFETHAQACDDPYIRRYCCLQSTNPIIVSQYSYGYTRDSACNGELGDPFMTVIPPMVQYLNTYHLVPVDIFSGQIFNHFFSVSVPTRYFQPANILLDDTALEPDATLWQPIYCTGDIICGYGITKTFDNEHHILHHTDPNAAIFVHTYGFNIQNSYALAGGQELQPISGTVISCTVPAMCVGSGEDIVVTCTRSQDLTEQTRIKVDTEDGSAIAPADYDTLMIPVNTPNYRRNNLLNYRGGARQDTVLSFSIGVNRNINDRQVEFFVNVIPRITAIVLTPKLTLRVGGCPHLDDPESGTVMISGYAPGSTATFTFDGDCTVVGELVLTCTSSCGWNSEPPICMKGTPTPTTTPTTTPTPTPVSVVIAFDPIPYTVTEGVDEFAILRLVRSGDLSRDTVVTVNPIPGSALDASDFTSDPVTVTFTAGQTVATAPVPITDDSVVEETEMFTATLSTTDSNVVFGQDTATVTILDNDVRVSFDPTFYTVTEGVNGSADLMLVRNGDINRQTVVTVTTVGGSATSGADYLSTMVEVTFEPGVTSLPVPVTINDDSEIEADEIFTAVLTTSEQDVMIGEDIATVTIIDTDECPELPDIPNGSVTESGLKTGDTAVYSCEDGFELAGDMERVCMSDSTWSGMAPFCSSLAVVVSFDPIPYTVTEGDDEFATLTLVRSGDLSRDTVVTVNPTPGSALAPSDFTSDPVTVTFTAGQTVATASVPIIDDPEVEDTEMFNATLSTTDSNVAFGQDTATVTILDNDVLVSFDPIPYTVTEGVDDNAILRLVRSGDLSRDTVVTVNPTPGSALAPSDFTSDPATVTFTAGQTVATAPVPITDDSVVEEIEMFTATLSTDDSNVMFGEDTATVTIVDDDVPDPQFQLTMYTVPEDNRTVPLCIDVGVVLSEPMEFVITSKSKDPPEAQVADYNPSTTITVTPPSTMACIDFTDLVVDDSIALEGLQNFTICVGGSSAWVVIVDDDIPMIDSSSIEINEDGGVATLTVQLLNEIEDNFTLNYTTGVVPNGADDKDFVRRGGFIRFVPGESKTQTIMIPITDDQETESDEPLIVSFSSTDIPDMQDLPTPMVTIIDNDIVVGFDPIVYTVTEGKDLFVILTLVRTGNVDLAANVSFMTVPGSANDTDFLPLVGNVLFDSGETSETVEVSIENDLVLEDIEMFTATIASDMPNVLIDGSRGEAEITIIDNDGVTIGFVNESYTVNEADGAAVVTVAVLFGVLSEDVVVGFNTQDDSATDPDDYRTTSTLLTFGPAATTGQVSIPITTNGVNEPTEQLQALLTLLTTGVDVTIRPSGATVFIEDDDVPNPVFGMTMYTVPEDDPGSVPLCVDIGVEITEPLTYTITTAQKSPPQAEDSDFTSGTTITIQPPGPEACINFTDLIVNDNLALEGNEAFSIFIVNTPAMAMVTITENDEVSVGFDPAMYTVSEGNPVELTLVQRGMAEGPIVITVDTADGTATAEDYIQLVGEEVILTSMKGDITVITLSDVPLEGMENFSALITATNPSVTVFNPRAMVTIIEEGDPPTIFFSTESVVVGEGDGAAEVCLNLSVPLSTDLSVEVSSTPGSAEDGIDFVSGTQTASFAAGSTRACVEFIIVNDNIALEGDETFTATFATPDGFNPGEPQTATIAIIDNDVFTIEFTESDYSFDEGQPNAEVCLQGSGEIAQPATATVSSLQTGTATAGEDYGAVNAETVVFVPNGDRIVCIPLDLPDDTLLEGEESFPLEIDSVSPVPGVEIGDQSTTTVFIRDNDTVTIGFDPRTYTVSEDTGEAVVTVRVFTGDLSGLIVVNLSTRDNTATDPGDYVSATESLTFTQTNREIQVPISLTNDNVYEPNLEEFIADLTLVTTDADVNVVRPTASIFIIDDDIPAPSFEMPMYTVPENDTGGIPLCVEIDVEITEPITYTITTAQKTPSQAEDADFGTSAQVTVDPPGPSSCIDFTDLVVDDNVALEGEEAFTIVIEGAMAMVTIIDDDEPEISSPDITVQEDTGNAEVCVILNNPVEGPLTVDAVTEDGSATDSGDYSFTVDFTDYNPSEGNRVCFSIPINDDDLIESDEGLIVIFGVNGVRASTATITIIDNDREPMGTIVNDTIIGDPLFTVTLPQENEFMCYEVHGYAGRYFNLISDTCTSVNALFTAMPDNDRLNRMSQIGMYTRDSTGVCVQVEIDLSGCTGSVDGIVISTMYQSGGVSVRSYPGRWRVSVPNCGTSQLVMWIFCESNPNRLRFHIARGNNLTPTSHGLLAQFWNIPIKNTTRDGEHYLEIFDPSHSSYRLIPAFLAPRTWDHTHANCYYVGNSQGGPSRSHDPQESVIEGKLSEYETSSLFATTFTYEEFEESMCDSGAA